MFEVSVIIPNYNNAKFLNAAIDSALAQPGVTTEVIVVDDGSTDNSREVLQQYGDRIRAFFQENKGAPAARNMGLKNSTARYVKFLDSDDVLLPNVLAGQVQRNEQLQSHQVTYGQAIWVDESLEPVKDYPVAPIAPGQDKVHHILTQNPLTSSVLHRRALLEKIKGFDEELVKGQEFDLHLRLVLAGAEFVYHDSPVYHFRQHASPNRISHANTLKKSAALFRMYTKQEEMIRGKFGVIPPEINDVLGKRYWNLGRGVLQAGDRNTAAMFFTAAKKLSSGCVSGSMAYRWLVKLAGPLRAERVMTTLRR